MGGGGDHLGTPAGADNALVGVCVPYTEQMSTARRARPRPSHARACPPSYHARTLIPALPASGTLHPCPQRLRLCVNGLHYTPGVSGRMMESTLRGTPSINRPVAVTTSPGPLTNPYVGPNQHHQQPQGALNRPLLFSSNPLPAALVTSSLMHVFWMSKIIQNPSEKVSENDKIFGF